jgi:hypothetical protein
MEYGLAKGCSGGSSVAARYSPEENLVTMGEAVGGRGFLRTGDEELDVVEETVSALDRIVDEVIPRLFLKPCSVVPGPAVCVLSEGVCRSDESEAYCVSDSGTEKLWFL